MGQRSKSSKKLALQKQTIRALQLQPLTDEQLRAAAGGMSATCSDCCAPSQRGC